ncbi:MAG: hypothetical protein ACUZ8E_02330 [Candidatus Anammoxibacter sp.]
MTIFKYLISGTRNIIYMEIYNALLKLGEIVSLREIGKGYVGIKEEYINRQLEKVDNEDNVIKSLRISCKKDKGLFHVELKKYLVRGIIEIPFQVDSFTFNSNVKEITFRIGKERSIAKDYYSRLLLWFTLTVIGTFTKNGDLLKRFSKDNSYLKKNNDGSYTIDLASIPELKEYFKRPYWKLIRVDGILLDTETVLLKLHKEFAEKIISIPKEIENKVKGAKVWRDEILGRFGDIVKGRRKDKRPETKD